MVTRLDVARLAGVSQSTVSRVINGKGYVSQDVRERILQSIKELNYVPNRLARSLRMQECRQIACITHSITNSFYSEIVAGIEEIALENGYTFSLYQVNQKKNEFMKVVLEGFYDGIIMLSPFEVRKIMELEEISKHLPIVLYWDREEPTTIPHVYVDLRNAMKKAVKHLIEQGHKEIVFFGYEFQDPSENPRYQGYIDAMEESGLPILPYYKIFIEELFDNLTTGYQKMKDFLHYNHPFSALVASNDLLAVGAMRAIMECGKKVPDQISVVGVDDVELASIVFPALTTVRIPKREIGNILMNQLLSQINGKDECICSVSCNTELICRESVNIAPIV